LPFENRSAPHATFKLEANGATWFFGNIATCCPMRSTAPLGAEEELYAKNGYSVYAPDNAAGRLIVTEDSLEHGLDQAIDQLRELFGK
jgi:hypothetical protein